MQSTDKENKMSSKTVSVADLQEQIAALRSQIAAQNTKAAASGEVPASYRPTPAADKDSTSGRDEMYQNRFDLPKSLREEIKQKGYNYKFINFTSYKKDTVHKAHWVPYKPEIETVADMVFGKSPEGYVVRGDCVLAVRPLSVDKLMKARIHDKAQSQLGFNKRARQEMEELARAHGVKKSKAFGVEATKGLEDDED